MAVLLTAALAPAASGGGPGAGPATRSQTSKLLGAKNPAKGAAVKVGIISNGKSANIDNTDELTSSEAIVKWINEYRGGIGGRPIDLVTCTDQNDPAKAADCANQMIQEKVAAVVIGQNGVLESVWTPLHNAGIPTFIFGAGNPNVLADTSTTFVMAGPRATLFSLPSGVAKKTKSKQLSAIIIDVPAATGFFKDPGPQMFKDVGVKMDLVAIAPGTADMTPQMQRVVSTNPKGAVFIVGNDAFCIAALNGLRAAGFDGKVATIQQCLTEATRTAVPSDFLKGIQISSGSPLDDRKHPATKQFNAVLDKYLTEDVDRTAGYPIGMFIVLSGLDVATEGLKGDVTSQSIIAAAKAMGWSELPGTGFHFRCNGKADPANPAVCAAATNAATLDASGEAISYTPVNDTPIPD
ncbi:MAG: hypothetical protein AMXMBFR46_18530 [Acidimicrobiia bacterium]